MNLVDPLVTRFDSDPVCVVPCHLLELPVRLLHSLLEFDLLIAFLAIVRPLLDLVRVRVDVESQVRFHQAAIWRLAPVEIKTLKKSEKRDSYFGCGIGDTRKGVAIAHEGDTALEIFQNLFFHFPAIGGEE